MGLLVCELCYFTKQEDVQALIVSGAFEKIAEYVVPNVLREGTSRYFSALFTAVRSIMSHMYEHSDKNPEVVAYLHSIHELDVVLKKDLESAEEERQATAEQKAQRTAMQFCFFCKKGCKRFKSCDRCRSVQYCSEECQTAHWE